MKKFRIVVIATVMIAAVPIIAFATAQTADRIVYDGQEKMLFATPLEDYFVDEDKRPNFMIEPFTISSGNWRGYIATWHIESGKLYLTNIDSWFCKGETKQSCRKVRLDDVFPDRVKNGKVFADWYSGELRIPDGKELQYIHSGFASTYERDIVFTSKEGVVTGPHVIDNTKREIPSELEAMRNELERLRALKEKKDSVSTSEIPKRPAKNDLTIIPGLNPFRYGASRKDLEELLGDGRISSRFDDVYFVEYPAVGVQVSYENGKDTVHVIFLYRREEKTENAGAPPRVLTSKGISWKSTENEVLAAYGKPLKDHSDQSKNLRRLEYPGIDFQFDGGQLGRIGILGPDGN